jgi:hypothetical protein
MNNLIGAAVNLFSQTSRFYGEDGKWVEENVRPIMEYLYDVPVGNQVLMHKYVEEMYGQDKVAVFMGRLMPYLTGPYGLLDISFETASGEVLTARNWEIANEIGKDNIKCFKADGTEVSTSEAFVVFRRNTRMELDPKMSII